MLYVYIYERKGLFYFLEEYTAEWTRFNGQQEQYCLHKITQM